MFLDFCIQLYTKEKEMCRIEEEWDHNLFSMHVHLRYKTYMSAV